MKVKDYSYLKPDSDEELSEERKSVLIKNIKGEISKKDTIALFKVLKIGENDIEYDFIYNWLDEHEIEVRGIDGTITGEINNYEQIRRYGQSKREDYVPIDNQIDYFIRIEKGKAPDATREDKLDAKRARDEFIRKNLKLADWIANNPQFKKFNYSFEQLQSFAFEGLVRAVDHFRFQEKHINENGEFVPNAFSSYAYPTIIRTIYREIYRESPLPIYLMYEINQMENFIRDYELANDGEEPTNEDIANILGLDEAKVEKIKKAREYYEQNGKMLNSIDESLESIRNEDNIVNSLDDSDFTSVIGSGKKLLGDGEIEAKFPYSDNGYVVDGISVDVADSVYEGSSSYVEEEYDFKELRSIIDDILYRLTYREKFIVMANSGLLTGEQISFSDLSSSLMLSSGRISQLYWHAIRKIKGFCRVKHGFLLDIFNGIESIRKTGTALIDPETPKEKLFYEYLNYYQMEGCYSTYEEQRFKERYGYLKPVEKFIVKANMGDLTGKPFKLEDLRTVFGRDTVDYTVKKMQSVIEYIRVESGRKRTKNYFSGEFSKKLDLEELYYEFIKSELLKYQEDKLEKLPLPIIEDKARLAVLEDIPGKSKEDIINLSMKIDEELSNLIQNRNLHESEEGHDAGEK